jgi:ketosteroid isomerase-like protein
MIRSVGLSIVLLLAACNAPADTGRAQEGVDTGIAPDGYRNAGDALNSAIAAKDADQLRSLIADDFLWVRGSGAKGDKVAFITALTSEDLTIEPFEPAEARWFVEGNTALLTGTNTLKGRAGGEPFVDKHRFADHWIWREGRWQLAYIQVTPVPDAK